MEMADDNSVCDKLVPEVWTRFEAKLSEDTIEHILDGREEQGD